MKKKIALAIFGLLFLYEIQAQNAIRGIVVDSYSKNPLQNVSVTLLRTKIIVLTDKNGRFLLENLSNGSYVLHVSFDSYETQKLPIKLKGTAINLGTILMHKDLSEEEDISIINITDDELNADEGFTDNIAGLLQSSRDIYFSAAAFDFSATFFRPRGLDNANGKVLINGLEMNKLLNGRPQWSNWGGLNDLQRNQVFTSGINPSENTFGDLAGTNSITMRASRYSEGGRVSYATANRSYQGRVMASYSSGISEKGWSYAVLASRRFGDEGYVEGTLYDSNSFFAAVEKQLGEHHSVNFNFIYAQNRRGRSTALTNEIYRLKGRQYNPFWGEIDGYVKNSRERKIIEPIFMLNHYWDISKTTTLNTNISYQFGFTGNTRIDNGGTRLVTINGHDTYLGGARNPSPAYYQNLPSFYLQDANPTPFQYSQAFIAQQEFVDNGQFNWNDLFQANQIQSSLGYNSIYVLQEDRIDDTLFSFNSILYTEISENIQLNAAINYRKLRNETYAKIKNLLGGTGYLDIDFFAEENQASQNEQILSNLAQSDLQNPNRIVAVGERYKYNYEMKANVTDAFVQAQFNYSKIEFYTAVKISNTTYQRNGLYENGFFSGNLSFGESDQLNFNNYGLKGGLTYKISGQHIVNFNAGYLTKAATIRNSFENPRQNNNIVDELLSEKISTFDTSYILRTPKISARLTGYYAGFKDGTDIGFFFTESGATFTQEIMTNIERRNFGGELGISAQVTPTIKLKATAGIGQFTFNNNPNIYYASDDFVNNVTFGDGTTKLKGLHVAGGPERALQLGFEYRDSDYWWIGATANHFSRAFVDASALKRTAAFAMDFDLIPDNVLALGGNITGYAYNDYDQNIAIGLLQQEQFNSYLLVNVIGGKSWKIGDYYLGFFATINNLFNKEYKTGGFEQSRRVGYKDQIQEQNQENGALFGNRYFFGNGTTYFINLNVRF